ncbi:MBL fold metallo-hydrolase [Thioalkalicoccus limnaeus]|uniref:MBL fold metallo-hydrolase n=1 Tax=Thioalkalicoccus limnaeus TaxID=120681 RepID=A0ABV4BGM1_9GAMM
MPHRILPVTPFQQNCTLLWCDATRETAIVDPGGDLERIHQAISDDRLIPTQILLTHGHIDHVGGAARLARELSVPIAGPHPDDAFLLESLPQQSQMFGLPKVDALTPDRWLTVDDEIRIGHRVLTIVHCPGHTPGHLVFVDLDDRLAQVGDVLFAGSIGRTDFPRGNHRDLLDSIRQRLFPLGDDIRFIPGHGPMSSFGEERRHNPFVGDRATY